MALQMFCFGVGYHRYILYYQQGVAKLGNPRPAGFADAAIQALNPAEFLDLLIAETRRGDGCAYS
jgi:hypothetical protein